MSTQTKYLKDYSPFSHDLPEISLNFNIGSDHTDVDSRLYCVPRSGETALRLAGSAELLDIFLEGDRLPESSYTLTGEELLLRGLPQRPFTLDIRTRLYPARNTALNGLYASGGNLYTQCEPEGFRTITYHPDRPDVMSVYRTRIEADRGQFPVLLSNGNLTGQGSLSDNRHWAEWHDPFAKPSYLFALVAGDFAVKQDTFETCSGRKVALAFYTRTEDADKVGFALASLKHAMSWDEQRFGLEYDLDIYMVVAVSDFNMGAMENKGLNIFNTKYVLADSRTATDADFEGVESVIAHEYFHNWTGNRVTCRDWFQLSLKEGLTVFRDQEFSGDRVGSDVCRIKNVSLLRTHQFPEDAGPMAHPVRPASYVEMNNFYTMTVYEKGAEVVRMYHTLLGEDGFQKGMKLYFQRHDGQAVTCDDFRAAMADANGMDLAQFALWYSQAGTPVLDVSGSLKDNGDYVLRVRQSIPPTPDMVQKQPMMMPLKVALFGTGADTLGRRIPFRLPESSTFADEAVLLLSEAEQEFVLGGIGAEQHIVPSLLRGFSAPVKLNVAYSDADLSLLLAYDDDAFARWEAGQALYRRAVCANVDALRSGSVLPGHDALLAAVARVLSADIDPALKTLLLAVPAEAELWDGADNVDPVLWHQAREALLDAVAAHCAEQISVLHEAARQGEEQSSLAQPYEYHPQQAAWRSLRNTCRALLLRAEPERIGAVAAQYDGLAKNMTHEWGILSAVNHHASEERNRLLERFAAKFADQELVLDKYFMLIASSRRHDTPARVQAALSHPAFKLTNPNKVRALLGGFVRNIPHFHAADGSGYRFIGDKIREIDGFNPQTAASLARSAFSVRPVLEAGRRALATEVLRELAEWVDLSKDTREVVEKILA